MTKLTQAQMTYLEALRSLSSGAPVSQRDVDKAAAAVSGTGKYWNSNKTVAVLVARGLVSKDVRWTESASGCRTGETFLDLVVTSEKEELTSYLQRRKNAGMTKNEAFKQAREDGFSGFLLLHNLNRVFASQGGLR